ncbi:MAG: hypothetical protein QOE63_97 [Acidimicrobiaceae bacterium]|jgi:hypothetical protein
MSRRTRADTGEDDALGDDRLAIYEPTQVPSGRATGLPPADLVRWRVDAEPDAPAPSAWNIVDLRAWQASPSTDPIVLGAEPAERFEPMVFELVSADPTTPEVLDPDAAPFEPLVFTDEALPPTAELDDEPPSAAVQAADDADRRRAPRYVLRVPAAATFERSNATELGDTRNVSAVGLLLHMAFEPPDTQLELIVGDEAQCALIWAKVIDHRAEVSGGFCWHLEVVSSDDAWTALVHRAADSAQPRSA